MTLSFNDINFSINLLEAAQNELKFLEKIDKLSCLYNPDVVKESIRRYEALWLPLIINYNGIITAPLDIYWVWHVHMLSPVAYKNDLKRVFGKIVDHKFLDDETYELALNKIKILWHSKYLTEPFEIKTVEKHLKFVSKFSYNIEEAAARQSSFYYQVSLPHFKSKGFLIQSINRYKMFLSLHRKNPDEFIVPCYDIDLIWHSHQIHPSIYSHDCLKILGKILNHDDSVTDRSPNSQLMKSEQITRDSWKNNYKQSFSNHGSMNRGEGSKGKLTEMSECHLKSILSKSLHISIDVSTSKSERFNYKLKIYLVYDSCKESCVLSYNYLNKKIEKKNDVKFQSNCNTGFRLELIENLRSCGMKKVLSSYFLSTGESFEKFDGNNAQVIAKCKIWNEKEIFDDIEIKFICNSLTYDCFNGSVILGEFLIVSLNLSDHKTLGPIPILQPNIQYCESLMASHSIQSNGGKHAFDVNIIHIMNMKQSIVQVFYDKKMYVVSHLIGNDQLPNPFQIESEIKYPKKNKCNAIRAMLIKDNFGDWMIVVARWIGMEIGVPVTSTTRTINGNPGYFFVEIYYLRENRYQFFKLNNLEDRFFKIDSLYVNVNSGIILLKSLEESNFIPNYICLAFSISVLFVLCQPRKFLKNEPGIILVRENDNITHPCSLSTDSDVKVIGVPIETQKPKSHYSDSEKIVNVHYEKFQLFLASGYLYDSFIPTNAYVKCCANSGSGCVVLDINEACGCKYKEMDDSFEGDGSRCRGERIRCEGSNGSCDGGSSKCGGKDDSSEGGGSKCKGGDDSYEGSSSKCVAAEDDSSEGGGSKCRWGDDSYEGSSSLCVAEDDSSEGGGSRCRGGDDSYEGRSSKCGGKDDSPEGGGSRCKGERYRGGDTDDGCEGGGSRCKGERYRGGDTDDGCEGGGSRCKGERYRGGDTDDGCEGVGSRCKGERYRDGDTDDGCEGVGSRCKGERYRGGNTDDGCEWVGSRCRGEKYRGGNTDDSCEGGGSRCRVVNGLVVDVEEKVIVVDEMVIVEKPVIVVVEDIKFH